MKPLAKLTRKNIGVTAAAGCAAWGIVNLTLLIAYMQPQPQQTAEDRKARAEAVSDPWNLGATAAPWMLSAISLAAGMWPASNQKQQAAKFLVQFIASKMQGQDVDGVDLKVFVKGESGRSMLPFLYGDTTPIPPAPTPKT